jgi:hypothetical protein
MTDADQAAADLPLAKAAARVAEKGSPPRSASEHCQVQNRSRANRAATLAAPAMAGCRVTRYAQT